MQAPVVCNLLAQNLNVSVFCVVLYCLFNDPLTTYRQLPGLLINNEFERMLKGDVFA